MAGFTPNSANYQFLRQTVFHNCIYGLFSLLFEFDRNVKIGSSFIELWCFQKFYVITFVRKTWAGEPKNSHPDNKVFSSVLSKSSKSEFRQNLYSGS